MKKNQNRNIKTKKSIIVIVCILSIALIIGSGIFIWNKHDSVNENTLDITHDAKNQTELLKEPQKEIDKDITIYYVDNNGEIKTCTRNFKSNTENKFKDFFVIVKEIYKDNEAVEIPDNVQVENYNMEKATLYISFNSDFKNIKFSSDIMCEQYVRSLVKTLISSEVLNNNEYEDVQLMIRYNNKDIAENIFGEIIETKNPLRL